MPEMSSLQAHSAEGSSVQAYDARGFYRPRITKAGDFLQRPWRIYYTIRGIERRASFPTFRECTMYLGVLRSFWRFSR